MTDVAPGMKVDIVLRNATVKKVDKAVFGGLQVSVGHNGAYLPTDSYFFLSDDHDDVEITVLSEYEIGDVIIRDGEDPARKIGPDAWAVMYGDGNTMTVGEKTALAAKTRDVIKRGVLK